MITHTMSKLYENICLSSRKYNEKSTLYYIKHLGGSFSCLIPESMTFEDLDRAMRECDKATKKHRFLIDDQTIVTSADNLFSSKGYARIHFDSEISKNCVSRTINLIF